MRIVCPVCSAAYDVRDDLLVPGRTVRCTRCSEEWAAVALAPPPDLAADPFDETAAAPAAPPPPSPPRASAMERLASHPAVLPQRRSGLRLAWFASLVLLAVLVLGLVVWRADIMHAWPPGIRLFDALGLGPSAH